MVSDWKAVLESFQASGRTTRHDSQRTVSVRLRVMLGGVTWRVMTTEHQDRWRALVDAIDGACPDVARLCEVLESHHRQSGRAVWWQRYMRPESWGAKVPTAAVVQMYRDELAGAVARWRERKVRAAYDE